MISRVRSIILDPIGRWIFTIFAAVSFGCLAYGILVNPDGYLGNLLAEVTGLSLSVLVGIVVVDWFVEYVRRRQWAKSNAHTLRAIAVHLCEIAGSTFLHFPGVDPDAVMKLFEGHILPPNRETLESFDCLLAELRDLPDEHYQEKSTSDVAVEFYEAIQWDLEQIQNVLTPRILQGPTDQSIADGLVEFDNAQRELRHSIIAHQQAVTHGVFQHVLTLVEAAKKVYALVLGYWEYEQASAA